MSEKKRLPVKEAARLLCDELAQRGQSLPFMLALDICSRLEGYLDWREYERLNGQGDNKAPVKVVYLNGLGDRGYWWTRATAEPWLHGAMDVDYGGPYTTQDVALQTARARFPDSLVMQHEAGGFASAISSSSGWQESSVYATIRVYFPMNPRITKVMHNPHGEDGRQMNESIEFMPAYDGKDGRIKGVTYRSPLKFLRFDTVRRCAAFEFNARLDISRPSGTSLPQLVDKFRFRVRLADTYEEPDIELVEWE